MPVESNPSLHWYVVHTFSGHETNVRDALLARIDAMGMQGMMPDVRVPMSGGMLTYPGSVLVRMAMNEQTFNLVKATPKVSGFIGSRQPTPLSDAEAAQIFGAADGTNAGFAPGDPVRILAGPFAGFDGVVEQAGGSIRVRATIHGRATLVDLDASAIARA